MNQQQFEQYEREYEQERERKADKLTVKAVEA